MLIVAEELMTSGVNVATVGAVDGVNAGANNWSAVAGGGNGCGGNWSWLRVAERCSRSGSSIGDSLLGGSWCNVGGSAEGAGSWSSV